MTPAPVSRPLRVLAIAQVISTRPLRRSAALSHLVSPVLNYLTALGLPGCRVEGGVVSKHRLRASAAAWSILDPMDCASAGYPTMHGLAFSVPGVFIVALVLPDTSSAHAASCA